MKHHSLIAVGLESLSELLHSLLKLLVSQRFRSQILVRAHVSILHNTSFNTGLILKTFFVFPSILLRGQSWGHTLAHLVFLRWLLLLFFIRACRNTTPSIPFVLAINGLLLLVFLFFLRFFRCFLHLTRSACTIVWFIDVVNQVVDIFLVNLLIPCLFLFQILSGRSILVFRLSLLSFIARSQTVHKVVPGDASATAGTTAFFLMRFELYAITVIISTYWLALVLLLSSVVRRLLLVVNRLLELPRFRPNLGFLLLLVFLHLLLFR